MTAAVHPVAVSRARLRAGLVLTGLAVVFLAFDTGIKVLALGPAVEGTTALGYPASAVRIIGVVQLACLALYLYPPTAVLGAVLFTGYLGGAIATHVRVGSPLLTHILFPLYVAGLVWGGLYLREARLRALLPLRR
jgi:hypothetical protein